jgi:hypothetical protein
MRNIERHGPNVGRRAAHVHRAGRSYA